jgi:hypothetical protein
MGEVRNAVWVEEVMQANRLGDAAAMDVERLGASHETLRARVAELEEQIEQQALAFLDERMTANALRDSLAALRTALRELEEVEHG